MFRIPHDKDMITVNVDKLDQVMNILALGGATFHSREEALDFVLDLFITNYLTSKELKLTGH